MLEKDFVFISMGNPQGYPQKLWIDVTQWKLHCHFLSWTVNESLTSIIRSDQEKNSCCTWSPLLSWEALRVIGAAILRRPRLPALSRPMPQDKRKGSAWMRVDPALGGQCSCRHKAAAAFKDIRAGCPGCPASQLATASGCAP